MTTNRQVDLVQVVFAEMETVFKQRQAAGRACDTLKSARGKIRDLYRDVHEYDVRNYGVTGLTWERYKTGLREIRKLLVEAEKALTTK